MSLDYIRTYYNVPAKKGARIEFSPTGGSSTKWQGTIVRAEGAYLLLKKDGECKAIPGPFHPTWQINYLDNDEAE